MLLAVAVVAALTVAAGARDKEDKDDGGKPVTLKGEFACAKCVLKLAKGKCVNAITVKKDDKEVVYFLDDQGGKESYHKPICTGTKMGSVTGVVSKKGDQLYIKPAKDGVKYED
jgi:hypothetical protein